jgi:PD-(D/E)XK nuclease superfamily
MLKKSIRQQADILSPATCHKCPDQFRDDDNEICSSIVELAQIQNRQADDRSKIGERIDEDRVWYSSGFEQETMGEPDSLFRLIWGCKEPTYSRVVAQTIALSDEFRTRFLEMLARRFDERGCHQTATNLHAAALCHTEDITVYSEVAVGDGGAPDGYLDIYIQFPHSFSISIENKKRAGLRPSQLLRYDTRLKNRSDCFVQVFLTPSRYPKPDETPSPDRFEHINYRDLANLMRTEFRVPRSVFESAYYMALQEFFQELEDIEMPLTTGEVWAAQEDLRQTVDAKLENIVANLCRKGEQPERNPSFILKYEEVAGWQVYTGFRRGTRKFYFKERLFNDQPEAIVFVKDIEKDGERAKLLNAKLNEISRGTALFERQGTSAEYFPRHSVDEARLVVRRSLSDFAGHELHEITDWLTNTFDVLRCLLEASEIRPEPPRPTSSQQTIPHK